MQLIKRAANGDYSKLLQTVISDYMEYKDNLQTVRGAARAFTVMKQLCDFYGIAVPSEYQQPEEDALFTLLRSQRPKLSLRESKPKFSEFDRLAYMNGCLDFMLEIPQDYERQFQVFHAPSLARTITRASVDFMLELWATGYERQKRRFNSHE